MKRFKRNKNFSTGTKVQSHEMATGLKGPHNLKVASEVLCESYERRKRVRESDRRMLEVMESRHV